MEKICGIYCIENKTNHKKYIGQSVDIKSRWHLHLWELKNNKHCNSYLQRSFNKYGENAFIFYILEECNELILDEREQYYINFYDTMCDKKGYNMITGGNSNKHYSDEIKRKISAALTGKHLSKETKIKISKNRKGKMCGENNPNFGKHLSEEKKKKLSIVNIERCKNMKPEDFAWSIPIICINTSEIFPSIKSAAVKYNLNSGNICQCCNGLRRYCGKLEDGTPIQWAYYNENDSYILKENVDEYIGNEKPVIQYDKKMNYIATYKSAREAERQTGIGYKMISRVCKGERPFTHGFHFEFA